MLELYLVWGTCSPLGGASGALRVVLGEAASIPQASRGRRGGRVGRGRLTVRVWRAGRGGGAGTVWTLVRTPIRSWAFLQKQHRTGGFLKGESALIQLTPAECAVTGVRPPQSGASDDASDRARLDWPRTPFSLMDEENNVGRFFLLRVWTDSLPVWIFLSAV